MTETSKVINIFYSYAPDDEQFQAELVKYLETLRRNGQIKNLHNRVISPGLNWKKEIDDSLNISDIILLLVSPDFISSDYCYGIEMERAIERGKAGKARVIPVLLRHVVGYNNTPFGELQPLPMNREAITSWPDRNAAFINVAEKISEVVKEVLKEKDSGVVKEVLKGKERESHGGNRLLSDPASSKGHPISRREALIAAVSLSGGALLSSFITVKKLEAEMGKMQLSQLRIGSIPQSNRISHTTQEYLDHYLSRKLDGINVTTDFVANTYQDAADALGRKDIEAALLGPYIYLYAAKKYQVQPIVLVLGTLSKDPYYYSYIITKHDSGIKSLDDLKNSNKEFAFGDKWSTSGYLYPRYFLKKAGITLGSDIKLTNKNNHVLALQAVLQGIQPVGAVDSDVYNHELGKKNFQKGELIILNEEDSKKYPIPQGPCVLRADIQMSDTFHIQDAFLTINVDDPSALADLGTAQIGGFAAAADQIYNDVRKIADDIGEY